MQSLPQLESETYKMDTSSDSSNNIIITRATQKRLINDLRDLMRNPLADQGIYYSHDERNMLKGYALIIGPSDTPYMDGFYLFEVVTILYNQNLVEFVLNIHFFYLDLLSFFYFYI